MMSPAEHYKVADALLEAAMESLSSIRDHIAKPETRLSEAEGLLGSARLPVQIAQAHAALAAVPEGVYQMARGSDGRDI